MSNKANGGNLQRFNEKRSAHVLPVLTRELELCRKRKLSFKSVGLLATYLGDRVGCDRSTLLRNRQYSALLLTHLASQQGAVAIIADTTSDPLILQAKLAAAKLEASNLRNDAAQAATRAERLKSTHTNSTTEFADLAMVLVSILHRYPEFVQIDRNRRELVDRSVKPSERVIAGPQRMAAFCKWMEMNSSLPLVQALLLAKD